MTAAPALHIHTPDQRLRVFVSSTLGELEDERLAVRRAIEELRLTPVMFELGARPYAPRALYRAYLDQSHVFLGIYWQSYGWVAPEDEGGVSGLEDEYLLSGDRPRLVYIRRPAAERQARLDELLLRIRSDDQASYRHFSTTDELARLVQDDLMVLLTERFEAGDVTDVPPSARPLSAPPVPLTRILGRDTEVPEIRRLLTEGCRILTLVGPGGVGKSRLAFEAAQSLGPGFADGVAFVPLESVDDPAEVMRVLAERAGATVEGAEAPLEVAIRHLAGRRILLLVDNFEQVLDAGTQLAALLDACPGVSALVTSRRPLRLRGERQYVVEPLAVPSVVADSGGERRDIDAVMDSPAVELFVEQAQRVRLDFVVDAGNAGAVADLVRHLDGLPLAIELAAARTNVLEPRQMLERLERGVQVSMSAGQDVPERQRTLRATLEWSNALLTPAQQTLLARMSVFADGATLEAIESVCAGAPVTDLLDDLSALLDNSLVRTDRQESEGQPRFVLLTTVREFAAEQLAASDDATALRHRFVEWAVETAVLGDPMQHRDAADRWPLLRIEARNLRLAAELLIEAGDWQSFARMGWGVLHWIYRFGDIGTFAGLAERALAESSGPVTEAELSMSARLHSVVAWARFLVGDVAGALAVQEAVDIDTIAPSDPAAVALLLNTRAMALPLTDGGREARAAADRSLAFANSTGFVAVSAYSHAFLSNLDLVNGDPASAEQHCRTCLAIAADHGMRSLEGQQHGMLGLIAITRGRTDEAREHLADAYDVMRVEPNSLDASMLLGHAAVLAAAEGDAEEAGRLSALADAAMSRLGLADWPVMQLARASVIADGVAPQPTELSADELEADLWDVLAGVLDLAPAGD